VIDRAAQVLITADWVLLALNNLCMQGITSSLSSTSLQSSVNSSQQGVSACCYDSGSCDPAVQAS